MRAFRCLLSGAVLFGLIRLPASGSNPAVAVEHGVSYLLETCRHAGAGLTCQFNLTSLRPDEYRSLWYAGKSFALDQSGNRMTASDVHADSVAPSDAEISLPGRRTVLTLRFDHVDKGVNKLSDLEMVGDDGTPILLKFSNIEVAPK